MDELLLHLVKSTQSSWMSYFSTLLNVRVETSTTVLSALWMLAPNVRHLLHKLITNLLLLFSVMMLLALSLGMWVHLSIRMRQRGGGSPQGIQELGGTKQQSNASTHTSTDQVDPSE